MLHTPFALHACQSQFVLMFSFYLLLRGEGAVAVGGGGGGGGVMGELYGLISRVYMYRSIVTPLLLRLFGRVRAVLQMKLKTLQTSVFYEDSLII